MKLTELEAAVEAVLFVAGEAVSLSRLSAAIGMDNKTTKKIVSGLTEKYYESNRGVAIIEIGDCYQMCTNKQYAEYIVRFVGTPQKRQLTQALLETLAIIAYKQPVMKAQIEEIRGVNADHAVNKLMEYGLVIEKGRANAPGRPILFGTSDEFLRAFGISNTAQLPVLSIEESL